MSQSQSPLDLIRIVLVEPQGAMNVGSTCRAMKNFGLRHLTLVRPGCELNLDAIKMAMHASDLLESARIVYTIPEAIEGSVLVLGTANRLGEHHEPNYSVREGIKLIDKYVKGGPITIMFGREEWGLTKDDLKYVMGCMRIVTAPENTSLNLSQAVLLIAYELYQTFGNPEPLVRANCQAPLEQPATTEELHRLYAHMEKIMSMSEFLPLVNPDNLLQTIRAFFHRSAPTKREINILLGIFSNIRGYMIKYVRNTTRR